jgi:ABC-type Fe3+-siderophore transport system permease subunit
MTIIGIILIIGGLAVAALLFTGAAPLFLANLPVPFAAWIGAAVVGAILLMLNRRPHD